MAEECIIRNTVTGETWRPDATEEIVVNYTSTATENPVERGVSVTDHVQRQADALTLKLTISESPSRPGNVTGATRVNKWIAFIQSCMNQPCTIVDFRTGVHTNMVCIDGPVTINTWRRVQGSYKFRQIVVVTATLVSNIGAASASQNITNATVKVETVDPVTLQTALDAANLTVQANLAAQPTTKPTPSTKQTSIAYELAHAAGLV